MILTIDKQVYTQETLRTIVANLAKNGVQKIKQSADILETIKSIAIYISKQNEIGRYVFVVNDLFLPAVKVFQNMEKIPVEYLTNIDEILMAIAQTCCLIYKIQGSVVAGDVLALIVDHKKSFYYEQSNKTQDYSIKVSNAAGPQSSKSYGLDTINQVQQQSPSICRLDLLMAEQISKNNLTVIKRQNIREGFNNIALIVINQLSGIDKQFKNKSPEFVVKYLQIITNLSKVMTSQYLIQLFKTVRESIWQYFTTDDESIIRNVSKQLYQNVWIYIELIFSRLDMEYEKNKWLEEFVVELTLPLIKSQLLKKKIMGTKFLAQTCNQAIDLKLKYVKESSLKAWVVRNKIFQLLFNMDTHDQVMQAGTDIIKFMVKTQNSLSKQQYLCILNIIQKGNVNLRKPLSKMMFELTLRFNQQDTQLILQQMKKMSPIIFNQQLIKTVYEIARYSLKQHQSTSIEIFQKLMSLGFVHYKLSVQEQLMSKYIDMIKYLFEKSISILNYFEYFEKVVNKPLETHNIVFLRKMLDLFPNSTYDSKYYRYNKTSYDITKFLIEQLRVYERLIDIINSTFDQNRKDACLDFLVILVKIYRDNTNNENYLSSKILEKLINHSKVFCQLLHYFRNQSFEELFTIIASTSLPNMDNLICLKQLFYYINRSNIIKVSLQNDNTFQVNIVPNELIGFNDLMNVILNTQNNDVRQDGATFISQSYTHLSPDISHQKQKIIAQFVNSILESIKVSYSKKQQNKLLAYLTIIQGMMNETQTKGVGKLISHSSLVNIESIRIVITNEITYGYGIERNYEAKFPSNLTLFELLIEIGKVFKCSPEDIILKYNQKEIKSTCNGLAIQELDFKDKILNAHKRNQQSIPKVEIIDMYRKLTEPAIKVFTSIHKMFSSNGQEMTSADAVRFVEASTNDTCSANDYRVTQLFNKFDYNKDGLLSVEGFLAFWLQACKNRQPTVWKNLQSLRIRPDLKRYQDVSQQIDYKIMTRYIIYQSDIYDILFQMTQNSKLKLKSSKLLKRLPTSKKIIQQTLQNIKFEDEDQFLSWYKLTLIEWMLHDKDSKQNIQKQENKPKNDDYWTDKDIQMIDIKSQKSQKSQKQEQKVVKKQEETNQPDITHINIAAINQWKQRFLQNKMFFKIIKQAESIANNLLKHTSSTSKNCLLLCLQILKRLCKVPDLKKLLQLLTFEVELIDLQNTILSQKLIPQLFDGQMNTEMLQPLLCFLFNNKDLQLSLIYSGLFYPQKQVRIITTNFLYIHQKIHNFNINILEIEPKENCQEFFHMLVKIIIEDDKIDLPDVFNRTYNEIKNHSVNEHIGSQETDRLFEGKLNVLNTILVVVPEIHLTKDIQQILIEKLHQTLFPNTRETLYNLLLKTDVSGLFKYLSELIQLVQPKKPSAIRSNYVGLYNLGCICYMNSMLQQFYMTSQFKQALLGIDTQKTIAIASKKGKQYKDNVLYQLQKMFTYLELSQRSQYNPEHLCYSYNSNINVGVQQDSQQFLTGIFQKIQTQLKDTCLSDLVDKVYGGKTLVTMKCLKCQKQKYVVEHFNHLQLEVKQCKTIQQSLQKFTGQQTINDYRCQFCKQEGILRFSNLYQVPNVLIVHLVRMVFDVETFERIKVHTKLEFPFEMNLKKYMKVQNQQSLPQQEECQYFLKGVVVHSGCAESGHYYSLIKNQKQWFKFDDSRVTSFNINDIAEETFGGRQEMNDWGVSGSTRSKNAYMLVYQKKIKTPWVIKKQVNQLERQRLNLIADVLQQQLQQNQTQSTSKHLKILKLNSYIRRDLQQDVIKDHKVLFHELQFYHQNFFKFLNDVIKKVLIKNEYLNEIISDNAQPFTQYPELMADEQKQQYVKLLEFMLKLSDFSTKAVNIDTNLIKTIIPYIDTLFFILPDLAEQFLMNIDISKFLQVLISHSQSPIRDLYRSILNRCINIVVIKRQIDVNDQTDQSQFKLKVVNILDTMFSLLYSEVSKNSAKFYQYFEFWKQFSFLNYSAIMYCYKHNFISVFIDYLLQKKSPIMLNPGNYSLSKYINPPIDSLLSLVGRLVVNSQLFADQHSDCLQYQLTQNDRKCLTFVPFYKMLIEQKQDFYGFIMIIKKFIKNNFDFSQEIASFLINGINKSDTFDSALIYMKIIQCYLEVEDDYQRNRLEWVLGVPQFIQSSPKQYSIKCSIRGQTTHYVSSIFIDKADTYKSVLELLYYQRKNPDNFNITGVSILLGLLNRSKTILQYVIALPPPSYIYGKYIDWISSFISFFQKDRSVLLLENKQQTVDDCINTLLSVYEKAQKLIISQRDQELVEQMLREQQQNERKLWQQEYNIQSQSTKIEEVQKQNIVLTQNAVNDVVQKQSEQIKDIPIEKSQNEQDIEQIKLEKQQKLQKQPQHIVKDTDFQSKKQIQVNKQYLGESKQNKDTEYKSKQILDSLYPLKIIGVTVRTQQTSKLTIQQGYKNITVEGEVLFTYSITSKPTGDDNLSINKDLFDEQKNYRKHPLKYFVQGDTTILPQVDEVNIPQILPTIIHLRIQTNTNIIITSKNPKFNYNFYYNQGIHFFNIPYSQKPIDQLLQFRFEGICFEEQKAEKKDGGMQTNNDFQFIGPINKQQHHQQSSPWECGPIECPSCTFINIGGGSLCEICQNLLSNFM